MSETVISPPRRAAWLQGSIAGHAVYNWHVYSDFGGIIACDCGWHSHNGLSFSGAMEDYALHVRAELK